MRGHRRTRSGVFFLLAPLLALVAGCGGGSGSAPVTAVPLTVPAPTAGGSAPTAAITIVPDGSAVGVTIAATSTAAILTVDSAAIPAPMPPNGTLRTSTLRIADRSGTTAAASVRAARIPSAAVRLRDRETRIPDAPQIGDTTRAFLELQRRSAQTLRRPAAERRTQGFHLGDQKTFALQGGTINGTGGVAAPIAMPATLVAQSAHANVWLDNAVAANAAAMNSEYPSGSADFATVSRDFETDFAIETQAFGPAYTTGIVNFQECAADGTPLPNAAPRPDTTGASDPHINIVISDQLQGSGEGGYFYGLDLLDQSEANCVASTHKPTVNGLPMIVIGSDRYPTYDGGVGDQYPANNETYWLTGDMPQTIAHEFQHYLHFINKYLQQHVDNRANPDAGTLDDSYIDEGCSVLAQDLVAGSAVDTRESPVFVRAFLLEPADFSLTSFAGYQPDAVNTTSANPPYGFFRNTVGNYGYAYLFVRYLYDRFGPAALKAIYAETNYGGLREPDTGPATAAAGGEPFAQLFAEFTTAVALHSGGPIPELGSDPAYHFDASVILRGPVRTYSRRLAPFAVRNIVQPGPLNPEIFSGAQPAGLVTLGAGQSVTTLLLDGGAIFISPQTPWPQGATLRATGATGGGASLGQGPLPTPTPAYY